MRSPRQFFSLLLAIVLVTGVLAPMTSATAEPQAAQVVRELASPDDDIPGVPLPSSPVTGSLTYSESVQTPGADWDDVFSLELGEGDTLRVSLASTVASFFVDLYGEAGWDRVIMPSAGPANDGSGYPQELAYTVGTAGTFYLDIYTSGGSGSYTASYTVTKAPISMKRLAGPNRYSTAIAVSKEGYASGTSPNVILATGTNFADALAASSLAGSYECPILLTQAFTLTEGVRAEIDRLRGSATANVMIMGSTAAISKTVEDQLKAGGGVSIKRIAGPNRYATAVEIGKEVRRHETVDLKHSWSGEAFVCNGMNYPDALAAAPLAAARKMPIVLVQPKSIPASSATAFTALAVTKAYIIGGPPAVSTATAEALKLPASSKTRIAGANRCATAATLASYAVDKKWATAGTAGVATGWNFPDALGGGPLIGKMGGVMLLTNADYLAEEARGFAFTNNAAIKSMRAFGSDAALSDDIFPDFLEAMKP